MTALLVTGKGNYVYIYAVGDDGTWYAMHKTKLEHVFFVSVLARRAGDEAVVTTRNGWKVKRTKRNTRSEANQEKTLEPTPVKHCTPKASPRLNASACVLCPLRHFQIEIHRLCFLLGWSEHCRLFIDALNQVSCPFGCTPNKTRVSSDALGYGRKQVRRETTVFLRRMAASSAAAAAAAYHS